MVSDGPEGYRGSGGGGGSRGKEAVKNDPPRFSYPRVGGGQEGKKENSTATRTSE